MSLDRKSNSKAASEDDVGLVHNLTTQIHIKRLEHILEAIAAGVDVETAVGDGKAVVAAGDWAANRNGITATPAAARKESKINKQLAELRENQQAKMTKAAGISGSNVIKFDDTEDY